MFSTLHKSRQIALIAMDRISDYLDLLRVEVKIREYQFAMRLAGLAAALLFAFLTTVFFGLAVIVSFWDSEYRTIAAWCVVLLYGVIAAVGMNMCLKHFRSPSSIGTSLRSELQRDIDIIRNTL